MTVALRGVRHVDSWGPASRSHSLHPDGNMCSPSGVPSHLCFRSPGPGRFLVARRMAVAARAGGPTPSALLATRERRLLGPWLDRRVEERPLRSERRKVRFGDEDPLEVRGTRPHVDQLGAVRAAHLVVRHLPETRLARGAHGIGSSADRRQDLRRGRAGRPVSMSRRRRGGVRPKQPAIQRASRLHDRSGTLEDRLERFRHPGPGHGASFARRFTRSRQGDGVVFPRGGGFGGVCPVDRPAELASRTEPTIPALPREISKPRIQGSFQPCGSGSVGKGILATSLNSRQARPCYWRFKSKREKGARICGGGPARKICTAGRCASSGSGHTRSYP